KKIVDCDVNRKGLSLQNGNLIFNNEFAIDRNIRRTLSKPLQYRQFEIHLSHNSLQLIKDFALDNLINWEFTKFWMTYNSFDLPTSKQHTKLTSWKFKASTQQLPTLDIMNRKFPDIMNGLSYVMRRRNLIIIYGNVANIETDL
ncbi:hypothetical protein RhiirA5_440278, partial [Rhizophagus irregularis]